MRAKPTPAARLHCARLGALAQLGERRLCKPEVTGSIPVRSTPSRSPLRFAEHDDFATIAFSTPTVAPDTGKAGIGGEMFANPLTVGGAVST